MEEQSRAQTWGARHLLSPETHLGLLDGQVIPSTRGARTRAQGPRRRLRARAGSRREQGSEAVRSPYVWRPGQLGERVPFL